jgi:hypothetical protein
VRRCRGDVFKLLLFLKPKNERSMKKIIAMFAILVIAKMASAQAVVATIITDVDDAGIIESHKVITQPPLSVVVDFHETLRDQHVPDHIEDESRQ